jgi:hypothetical protein
MGMVSTEGRHIRLKHMKAALGLLEHAGSATTATQQPELDMRGTLSYNMRTAEKKQSVARAHALMAQNSSLRMEPLGQYFSTILPQFYVLFGQHPAYWDAGKVATQDTVGEGIRLHPKIIALFAKAVEESVGARKECIRITLKLNTGAQFMVLCATDEMAEMYHQILEANWGKDGSILTTGCMEYRFDRHFMITQGIGNMADNSLAHYAARGVAEYCGDVQQMVSIFEQQLGVMREYGKIGVIGDEHCTFWFNISNGFMGSELQALHPFGKELTALLNSYEGWCTDPSDCEGWYGSVDFSTTTGRIGDGISSKDGLHHLFLKSGIISYLQAIVSICLASTGKSNIDLTWLDNLPAPDDPALHDGFLSCFRLMNTRVLIAEVLESQGRYKEALRCANSCSSAHLCMLY